MTILRARRIQDATCRHFGIDADELVGPCRLRTFVQARHIAMWLCRQRLHLSYHEIAFIFGRRDHSTVIDACQKIKTRLQTDLEWKENLSCVEALLAEVA